MSDKFENIFIFILFIMVIGIYIYLFTNSSYLEEMTSLTRSEFESIYQDTDLSPCLWVNDTALQESKEKIAPKNIIISAMTKKCDLAKNLFFLNRSPLLFKPSTPTYEDLDNYIDTSQWRFRYKIILSDWEKNLDTHLKDAMNTW